MGEMDEVMAAVERIHTAGWQHWAWSMIPDRRKAVEQAVARLVWRELTIQGCSTLGYCDNCAQIEKWRALAASRSQPAAMEGRSE